MKNTSILGKQYGTRRNAQRAIHNFLKKNTIKTGISYGVNQIDVGCYEIISWNTKDNC
jgi:hypothetical protein